jgi:hypothetical protein
MINKELPNDLPFDIRTLIQSQAEPIAALQKMIDELKNEIFHLNNTLKRPKFRKSGMEPSDCRKKSSRDSYACSASQVQDNPKKKKEEKRIAPEVIPEGSQFKGHQEFVVKDVELQAKEITYKLEVWEDLNGVIHRGNLSTELDNQHFGPEVRVLIINVYAQCMTQLYILDFLQGVEMEISFGQIHNILMQESSFFSAIAEKLLSAGLKAAEYVQTDDTRAKHRHKTGYFTYIGGKYFSYYKSSQNKSRENVRKILLQRKEGYYVNDGMICHLFQGGMKDHILYLFEECQEKKYTSKEEFQALFRQLSITGKKLTERCLEAVIIGFIAETIFKEDQVLLSDRAGQFSVFNHAACWIHIERPVRKIPVTNTEIEKEINELRGVFGTPIAN